MRGDDGKMRCWWCASAEDYRAYHDDEWGYPVVQDHRLFEKLCLEGFQSGLSWITILRKREGFRRAFASFDFEKVARFGPAKVDKLLENTDIVRHRKKIESAIHNARQTKKLVSEFGSLAAYVWRFEPTPDSRPRRITRRALIERTTSSESIAMAKDLKKRGFTFVGPTTVYAFMQAMGLVNDHVEGCWIREPAKRARARCKVPTDFERPSISFSGESGESGE